MNSFRFLPCLANCSSLHEILWIEKTSSLDQINSILGFLPENLNQILQKPGQFLLEFNGNKTYLLVSLGEHPTQQSLQSIAQSFFAKNLHLLPNTTCINAELLNEPLDATKIQALMRGILLSNYKVTLSENAQNPLTEREIFWKNLPDGLDWEKTFHAAKTVVEARAAAMHWVDLPSNIKTPQFMRDTALALAQNLGLDAYCLEGDALEKEGLSALSAVGRGSERPPLMVVLKYDCGIPEAPHLGLVGKGVTFDTGGISIKPSSNLHFMKSDMGGAAAVLGAVQSIARLQLPIHLTCALPFTENCVDAKAIKPGDVISSYSGKTIEIIDTDAEGRLILADALSYLVKNHPCDYLLDMATLTGSAVRTFGSECAALFSNHLDFQNRIQEAGEICGEKSWPLPLWKSYAKNLHSDLADIANYSGKPICGAIDAALFLQFFTDNHPAWAHLDIAGVAYTSGDFSPGKSASGYGVQLITQLAILLSKQ
jgi:leucyl aminopeptidase